MNRILLLCLVVVTIIAGCSKDNTATTQAVAQAAADSIIIHNYITANNLTGVAKEIKQTGEFYIIDTAGTGNALFTSSTLVTVGFTASILGSSTPFTTTNSYHPAFTLGSTIQGWQLGIPYISTGGTIRLIVPSGYAYGPYPQASYGLPGNAILDFTIKLYNISN